MKVAEEAEGSLKTAEMRIYLAREDLPFFGGGNRARKKDTAFARYLQEPVRQRKSRSSVPRNGRFSEKTEEGNLGLRQRTGNLKREKKVSGAASSKQPQKKEEPVSRKSRTEKGYKNPRFVKASANRLTESLTPKPHVRQDAEQLSGNNEQEAVRQVTVPLKMVIFSIVGFFYSIVGPFLLALVGIIFLVALVISMIASFLTVTSASVAETVLSHAGFIGTVPYYNQGDYRDVPFNDGTISSDGCGITSFAMAASGLTGTVITPPDVAEVANTSAGYNTVNTHDAIGNLADYYEIGPVEEMGGPRMNCCGEEVFDREELIRLISDGHPVILSMTGGRYNPSGRGHYILVYGAGENGAYVYDPGNRGNYEDSLARGGHGWDEVFSCAKHIWIFDRVEGVRLTGATDAERLFHALKEYGGMSDAAAAGVVGNVYQETNHGGEDIDIHAEDAHGGGIVAWTDYTYSDGSRITNFTDFKAYAAEKGDPWPGTSLETQVEYLLIQLESGDWYWSSTYSAPYGSECNMSYEEFKRLTDVDLATRTFCAKFERPVFRYSDIDYRIEMAQKVYDTFAGK